MIYRSLVRPLLFRLPSETAHELALASLSLALSARVVRDRVANRFRRSPFGEIKRFGLSFVNPIGLAAGFDKDGVVVNELAALGFGFIEAGTVTNLPQPGNERPRLFRLTEDKALINRAGFNNAGAEALAKQISKTHPDCVLGVSIGKSKKVPLEEAVEDYLKSFAQIHPIADYVAVNVSSPNTPGLRELQKAEQLEALLRALQRDDVELSKKSGRAHTMPLLVKLAPDLEKQDLEIIVDVVRRTQIAGIIATNTTTERRGLRTSPSRVRAYGEGGLSGAPLKARSTQMIAQLYRLTGGSVPLIGVGGVFTAEDAWEKICAGASLVQLYTGFIYQGPGIARDINDGLGRILEREKYDSLDDAVGSRADQLANE